MIEFLGTPLLKAIPQDQHHASLSELCHVDDTRASALVTALVDAKKNAFMSEPREMAPGLPTVNGQVFSIAKLLVDAELDTDTPAEILLVGILIGRIYSEMEQRAKDSEKRVVKMLALMAKDPAKALRKMQKDLLKAAKQSK